MRRGVRAALVAAATATVGLASLGAGARAGMPAATAPDFVRDVAPIFRQHCVSCHGPKDQESRLRLDSRRRALRGRDVRHRHRARAERAEPARAASRRRARPACRTRSRPCPPRRSRGIAAWIDAGAPGPEDAASPALDATAAHWAYAKPQRPRRSLRSRRAAWIRNPIDAFVLARLESEGLSPSPEAERETLVRRAQPRPRPACRRRPAEIDAFVADPSPDAYERVVDRLLASPHYGERWARPWLDLARYADTQRLREGPAPHDLALPRLGDRRLQPRPALRPVHDRAARRRPAARARRVEQKIATGFHRNTQLNQEGGIDDEEFRVEAVVDRVNTTGTVWLGTHRRLRAVPQPQVRPDLAEGVLPDLRLLRQRRVLRVRPGRRGGGPLDRRAGARAADARAGDAPGGPARRGRALASSWRSATSTAELAAFDRAGRADGAGLDAPSSRGLRGAERGIARGSPTARSSSTGERRGEGHLHRDRRARASRGHGVPSRGPARPVAAAEGPGPRRLGRLRGHRARGERRRDRAARVGRCDVVEKRRAANLVLDAPRLDRVGRHRGRVGRAAHALVVQAATPSRREGRPDVTLAFESGWPHVQASLGRFRLSATTRPGSVRRPARAAEVARGLRHARRASRPRESSGRRSLAVVPAARAVARRRRATACGDPGRARRDEGRDGARAAGAGGLRAAVDAAADPGQLHEPRRARLRGGAGCRSARCRPTSRRTASASPAGSSSPDNPLTARVTVNRLWETLFGRGLVAHRRGLRHPGRAADAPGAARLARRRVRAKRLEPEGAAAADRDLRHVPPALDGHAGAAASATPTTGCSPAGPRPARGRDGARHGARRGGPARPRSSAARASSRAARAASGTAPTAA